MNGMTRRGLLGSLAALIGAMLFPLRRLAGGEAKPKERGPWLLFEKHTEKLSRVTGDEKSVAQFAKDYGTENEGLLWDVTFDPPMGYKCKGLFARTDLPNFQYATEQFIERTKPTRAQGAGGIVKYAACLLLCLLPALEVRGQENPTRPAATPDAQLVAEGFRLIAEGSDGSRLWSRPASPVTHLSCGSGGCGSLAQRGCADGSCGTTAIRPTLGNWSPAPRIDKPTAPPTSPPPAVQPAPPALDVEKLIDKMIDKLANDPRFRGKDGKDGDPGPAGPAGPPGKDGRDGKDGAVAEIDYDRLSELVLQKIDYDRIAGMVSVPAQPKSIHYVVVREESGADGAYLDQKIRYAQARFAGIKVSPPPAGYTGLLPAVVKYTNGVPEYVARGLHQTTTALDNLSRAGSL